MHNLFKNLFDCDLFSSIVGFNTLNIYITCDFHYNIKVLIKFFLKREEIAYPYIIN
jgi:hypothetical protein